MKNKCVLVTDEDLTQTGKLKSITRYTIDDFEIDKDILKTAIFIAYVPLSGLSDSMWVMRRKYGKLGWYKLTEMDN